MVEYKPWSKNIVNPIISKSNRELPILDIQLGGTCNLNCIYCDTPKYGFPCSVDLETIERLINEGHVEWIYICGLGEPTAPGNIFHLKKILELCSKRKIGLSMFSNIVNIDDDLLKYIDNGTLHVLFKLDTFDKTKMFHLYGRDKSNEIIHNINALQEVNHVDGNTSNLGASIVPTSVNYDELPHIIDYCMEQNIFPLIGQLENAGKGSQLFNKLELSDGKLVAIREYLRQQYGVDYEMPICPATISAIHITNANKIIVDERTGLSCPWFWLDEPVVVEIGDIRTMNYIEVTKAILGYRKQKFDDVVAMEESINSYPFGGCGGDVKQLLKTYTSINRR